MSQIMLLENGVLRPAAERDLRIDEELKAHIFCPGPTLEQKIEEIRNLILKMNGAV